MTTVPPIRRKILVDAVPAAAFETFTAGLGRRWPLDELSAHGKGATVAFADGQIVERSADGEAAGADRTLVRLERTGWDAFDDPAAARAEYEHGWPLVLGRYQEQAGRDPDGETWVALLHRPGPAGWVRRRGSRPRTTPASRPASSPSRSARGTS